MRSVFNNAGLSISNTSTWATAQHITNRCRFGISSQLLTKSRIPFIFCWFAIDTVIHDKFFLPFFCYLLIRLFTRWSYAFSINIAVLSELLTQSLLKHVHICCLTNVRYQCDFFSLLVLRIHATVIVNICYVYLTYHNMTKSFKVSST